MNAQKALTSIAAMLMGITILGAPVYASAHHLDTCPVKTTTTEIAKPLKLRKL